MASVLLIIGGGIAAYKSLELVRLLTKNHIDVTVVMSKAAEQFVTQLSLASLSGHKVYTDLFSLTDEVEMGHIELSRSADLLVVAPATADLLAKMASGLCNDLASTTLLATDKPVMVAPTMNVRMWDHAATQHNMAVLQARGITLIGPDEGEMACGEFGLGRMSEPEAILAAVLDHFKTASGVLKGRHLKGRHVLITAGPTREPIDPVRYISNHSSGKQGYALAAAAARFGARVTLVSGPVNLAAPLGVTLVRVETAEQMLKATQAALPADIAVFAAAVADWRVGDVALAKLKKTPEGKAPHFNFVETADILKTISTAEKNRPQLVIGFAAETEKLLQHGQRKLENKGCDMIIANDVSTGTSTFGGERNRVHLISRKGHEDWPEMSKHQVAEKLMQRCAELLK